MFVVWFISVVTFVLFLHNSANASGFVQLHVTFRLTGHVEPEAGSNDSEQVEVVFSATCKRLDSDAEV